MALIELEQDVRRIVAPNPSPMTLNGTCSYVLGTGAVAVIDPGPADPAHLQAILGGLHPQERVAAIFVTHAHLDHSPGARLLAEATGARIHAFGAADAGRSPAMAALATTGYAGGGEGVDHGFTPDVVLADGEEVAFGDWRLRALHTPGHFGNHLSFQSGGRIFSGDIVMGWSTTLISPPDGDLGDYFRSLEKLAGQEAQVFYPGHGDPVHAPAPRLFELAEHRHARSAQILAVLQQAPASVAQLTAQIYPEITPLLRQAAARNVFAHLVEMASQGRVEARPLLSAEAVFCLR